MKFEYDTPEDDKGPVVAYIDHSGGLIVALSRAVNGEDAVWFASDGRVYTFKWGPGTEAVKKFHKGDKITITF